MKRYLLVVSAETEEDLEKARDEYRAIDPELDDRLRREVDECMDAMCERPLSYPRVYKDFRRALLRKFPFFILFTVFGDSVIVFGCIPVRANPDSWKARL